MPHPQNYKRPRYKRQTAGRQRVQQGGIDIGQISFVDKSVRAEQAAQTHELTQMLALGAINTKLMHGLEHELVLHILRTGLDFHNVGDLRNRVDHSA
jgi:hypothetical protein